MARKAKTPAGVPGAWYDQPPAGYARGLRYGAERSDESAARKEAEGKPWSAREADHFRRQARRLRAMALLCDRSTTATAGEVDFMGLSDPTTSRGGEDATIARIEAIEPIPKGGGRRAGLAVKAGRKAN